MDENGIEHRMQLFEGRSQLLRHAMPGRMQEAAEIGCFTTGFFRTCEDQAPLEVSDQRQIATTLTQQEEANSRQAVLRARSSGNPNCAPGGAVR